MSTTIPKETLSFFNKLSKNNDRDWFNTHKPEFKAIEAKVKSAYNHLGELEVVIICIFNPITNLLLPLAFGNQIKKICCVYEKSLKWMIAKCEIF